MITSRRSLFGFGAALIAAPAIVRVASIMPVSAVKYAGTVLSTSEGGLTIAHLRTAMAALRANDSLNCYNVALHHLHAPHLFGQRLPT